MSSTLEQKQKDPAAILGKDQNSKQSSCHKATSPADEHQERSGPKAQAGAIVGGPAAPKIADLTEKIGPVEGHARSLTQKA